MWLEELLERQCGFNRFQAEQPVEIFVAHVAVAADIPRPGAHVGGKERQPQPLLAARTAVAARRALDRRPGSLRDFLDERDLLRRPGVRSGLVRHQQSDGAAALVQRHVDRRADRADAGNVLLLRVSDARVFLHVVNRERPPGPQLVTDRRAEAVEWVPAGHAGNVVVVVGVNDPICAVFGDVGVVDRLARRCSPRSRAAADWISMGWQHVFQERPQGGMFHCPLPRSYTFRPTVSAGSTRKWV